MITFGLITEGLTDQIVIENILSGYFDTNDLIVNPLQPERDKDNDNKSGHGGWTLVFEYCKSEYFKQAFQFNKYVIIHIDTDVLDGYNSISHRDENGVELSPEQLIEKVKEEFKSLIGEDFYSKYYDKIIFAIAVHTIECWLLPLYYTEKKKKQKIKSCLGTLNQALNIKEDFTIDKNAKNPEYYRIVSKAYSKRKILIKHYPNNPSLKIFIQEIESRKIVIDSDD
ncbi:phage tail protein [Planktothrix mougeotii]|uniref:Phage tail protein n=1 Tax=Planktothrix mougeotii LEGE 06226 TaxID=1828728 RepID=A0ABR9UIH2_9CYAN|nr:phage tail protein [Planktothrix mougeotii]MBE9146252.1 phage tail protein [Planktothrix mougeotii LEGE 06226]